MTDATTELPVEAVPLDVFSRLTGISRPVLYRALSSDPATRRGLPQLPSLKAGRCRRILLADGRAWLRSMIDYGQAA